MCLFVCRATHPLLAQIHPDLLHGIRMTTIDVSGCFYLCRCSLGEEGERGDTNSPCKCVSCHRIQVGEGITCLHHLQYIIPVPTFRSAVRCFEFEVVGMFLLHARNPGDFHFAYIHHPNKGMCHKNMCMLGTRSPVGWVLC